jgi:hypothetical protein
MQSINDIKHKIEKSKLTQAHTYDLAPMSNSHNAIVMGQQIKQNR